MSMRKFITLTMVLTCMLFTNAQTTSEVLSLLVQNKVISQQEVDTLKIKTLQNNLANKKFKMDLDIRPRTEMRYGYKQMRVSSSKPSFITTQRSRIGASYIQEGVVEARISMQDARAWGQYDNTSLGSMQLFEGWVEPYITKNLSVRIGRQILSFDNQSLFAERDWNPFGFTHDAANLRFYNEKINSDLTVGFNQKSNDTIFGNNYTNTNLYKFLSVSFIKYKASKEITLSMLNCADGFQAKDNTINSDVEKLFMRYTHGGRVEYLLGGLFVTFSGYTQWGKTNQNKSIQAWYIFPEISYTTTTKLKALLGLEILSGNSNKNPTAYERNFNTLYRGLHKFSGFIDIMDNIAKDQAGAGLVNPYLTLSKNLFSKFDITTNIHTFFLQKDYYNVGEKIDDYLGWENDWILSYKMNASTKFDIGFAYLKGTESMAIVKKAGNRRATNQHLPSTWAFASLSFKPQLFSTIFK